MARRAARLRDHRQRGERVQPLPIPTYLRAPKPRTPTMEGTRRRGRADQALAVKHTWKPPEHGARNPGTPGLSGWCSERPAGRGLFVRRGELAAAGGGSAVSLAGPCPHARPPDRGDGGKRARPTGRGGASAAGPLPAGRPAPGRGAQVQAAAAGRRAHAGGRGGAAPGDRPRSSRRARGPPPPPPLPPHKNVGGRKN